MLEVRRLKDELGLALDRSDEALLAQARARAPAADFSTVIESVLVHETWFFRDPAVFEGIAEAARGGKRPLRVLSAPCSTGEEAYSAAIALLRAGLEPGSFTVLGVDVSEVALSRARAGRYGASAFRQSGASPEACGFERAGNEWTLPAALRTMVRFRRDNLVAPGALADESPFDVVLCRNLFVYLSEAGQARLWAALRRWIAPGGTLFLGHADALPPEGFARLGAPERFAWRREAPGETRSPSLRRGESPGRAAPALPDQTAPPASAQDTIESARRLADAGDLERAIAVCERFLSRNGHDAEGYALLGALHHARGNAELALRAWQRAVYLDPEHPDALLQLGLALRVRGEEARASALLARAGRGRRAP